MKRILSALFGIALLCTATDLAAQGGPLSAQTQTLKSEILITTLPTADLKTQVTAADGKIEHMSEVSRTGPVAVVLRVPGCQRDKEDNCKINADIVVHKPDGTVHHEVKTLDLPQGRGALPLPFNAQSATGVYHVVATVRDLATRRFEKVERKFGVK